MAIAPIFTAVKSCTAKLIKSGSQLNCSGSVNIDQARSYCNTLNQNPFGICFPQDQVTDFVLGGTCSAMSFDFADRYLRGRANHLTPEEVMESIGSDYTSSSEIFRTRQAAFNTIRKEGNLTGENFMQAKIASMLQFHNRQIVTSSPTFDLKDPQGSLRKIEAIVNRQQNGVFIVRCLRPENNYKEEALGHSMVLIRDGTFQYFYNPSEGVFEFEPGFEAEALHSNLSKVNSMWGVSLGRIYQIA